MLLALDTSTPLVSVALHDGAAVVADRTSERPMQHGEQLVPLIETALRDAGVSRRALTSVAVGVGPGPYTGLRVGLVTARTLGLALGIPVVGVSSLDVLAASRPGPLVATLDARRKELFWAVYDASGRRVDGPHVSRPADVPADLPVVGAGPVLYPDDFALSAGPVQPSAAVMAVCVAEGRVEIVDPEPVYLRRPDAVAPGAPKRVS